MLYRYSQEMSVTLSERSGSITTVYGRIGLWKPRQVPQPPSKPGWTALLPDIFLRYVSSPPSKNYPSPCCLTSFLTQRTPTVTSGVSRYREWNSFFVPFWSSEMWFDVFLFFSSSSRWLPPVPPVQLLQVGLVRRPVPLWAYARGRREEAPHNRIPQGLP